LGTINSSRNNLGFTLAELLIVIAIIGVLAGGITVALNPSERIAQSKDGVRKSDLRLIQSALEMYRSDLGAYPPNASLSSCGPGNSLIGGAPAVTYMQKIPCDPVGSSVSYTYTVVGSGYTLRACLQNAGDPDRDAADSCTGANVSYTITNP
jgi:prepilin-type N-terminal cleavage/methylation domain-containing protein